MTQKEIDSVEAEAQHIVDRWRRDAVSPTTPPYASDDLDLLPGDISLGFPFRGAFTVALMRLV